MRRFGLAAIAVLVLASAAAAKGPVQVCGPNACATLGSERAMPIRIGVTAEMRLLPPVAPAPFYVVRFRDVGGALAYWVPSAGVVRLRTQRGRAAWFAPSREEAAGLAGATEGLAPYRAPARVGTVSVDGVRVPAPRGYLRLYSIGSRVESAPGAGGWLRIFAFSSAESPWTDGTNSLWISRREAYLRRDGQLVRIPAATAERIRARQPLT